ncbi:MAG TPA: prephenate dehydrogenase/arogenate dehydrogenase family protein, partial [Anaerolineae bacterium]|nr:prephenate dehydrogenase/arogenate dehydrogenase family protein [Anaerolineae bacterium]
RITIVGLGFIGTSIGLALKATSKPQEFELVGHDKEPKAASLARKRKAVDRTEWNLISACEPADMIILALPVAAIHDTLAAIAQYLKPGCLVTDTASLKGPVLAWAEELLPREVDFVGGDPIVAAAPTGEGEAVTGGEAASASIFKDAFYCLTPAPFASAKAVQLTADMATRLGAKPYFLDAAEHDGLIAAVDHLPALLANALLSTTVQAPAWREMRKLAGGQYQTSTQLMSEEPDVFIDACLHNAENVVRWIDSYIASLQTWRQLIANEDREGLEAAFEEGQEARRKWLSMRAAGLWEEREIEMPEKTSYWRSLFGMGGFTKTRRSKDK